MHILFVAAALVLIILASAALFGPQDQAPALPSALVGDGAWLAQAHDLNLLRVVLSITSLIIVPVVLWVWVQQGWSARLRRRLGELGFRNQWLQIGAYAFVLEAGLLLLVLPLNYLNYLLRRHFGLSAEPQLTWLIRQFTEGAVGFVPTLIGIEGLYWLMRRYRRMWWLAASGAYVVFSVALVFLQPLLITPLFFEQRRLDDPDLRARIVLLAQRVGIRVDDVFVIDASKRGNEGNAYFTGVAGSTRIVLYDTLIASSTPAELDVVLAHEMGHWRTYHIWKTLVLSWLLAPVGLLAVHLLLHAVLPRWGIRRPADIASLPLFLLTLSLASTATLPAQSWYSRRQEQEADRIALEATGDPQTFANTMVGLARQNLSEPTPSRLQEAIFATHPPVGRRVADAFEWAGSRP